LGVFREVPGESPPCQRGVAEVTQKKKRENPEEKGPSI